jgi:uncharacterized RDD family membrane protein YckC
MGFGMFGYLPSGVNIGNWFHTKQLKNGIIEIKSRYFLPLTYTQKSNFMNTNYAGFWQRFLALVIDSILIGVIRSILVIPILAAVGLSFVGDIQDLETANSSDIIAMAAAFFAAAMATAAISSVISILYFSFMESSKYQASVGKLALGLIVTDMEGNRIDFGKALLRNFGKLVSGAILLIGYIMAGFTDKKQALHDMIASTLVLKK